jgi:acetylornithine deacetylase/succinyl-diaminopimelate desuccinylase-like protein
VPGAVDALVADALEICAVAAPTFAEGRRAALVATKLAAATGSAPVADPAGNLIVRFGAADGPAAIVAAHLDTVFDAATPLEPARDGDMLRGPGIGDDSLAVAALVHLAKRLAARPAPSHPIVLAATVGEEGLGDLLGARALLDGVDCDAFVALEGHGLDSIQVSGIGSARLIATATGPGGHSWGDRGRPSAVHALVVGLQRALAAAGGGHVNVGVIRGGTSINTIAATAEAEIDLRDADDAVLGQRTAAVEAALAAAGLHVRRVGRRPGGATDPDHPLLNATRAARAAAGLRPAEEAASSTDANAALGRGIAAVCVSLTHGAGAHTLDEHVELGPLPSGVRALELLVDALAGGLPVN